MFPVFDTTQGGSDRHPNLRTPSPNSACKISYSLPCSTSCAAAPCNTTWKNWNMAQHNPVNRSLQCDFKDKNPSVPSCRHLWDLIRVSLQDVFESYLPWTSVLEWPSQSFPHGPEWLKWLKSGRFVREMWMYLKTGNAIPSIGLEHHECVCVFFPI